MNEAEIVTYLANVMCVARADSVLQPEEESALEAIRTALKAKKTDMGKAEKIASKPDYQPTPVGCYSDKIRNFEDMVFVALADTKIDPTEKVMIVAFAKQIAMTQDQVNIVISEARSRVQTQAQTATIACPGCKRPIPAASKFCPECGSPVVQALDTVATRVEFEYPSQGVSIEFAESSSATFDTALSLASKAPSFEQCVRSKKRWFLATWRKDQILQAVELADALKGIRNRKSYLDGRELPWDELFAFVPCLKQRQSAFKPVEFCFGVDEQRINLWGCKQARMDWTEWAEWFSYGHFRKRDVFLFDKARIGHELETNLHGCRLCPFVRPRLVARVLALLPDEVRVSERTGWKHKESYHQTPNSIHVVLQERQDGVTFRREFYADGVAPVGFAVAGRILTEAFKQCGIHDVDIRSIAP
ncbi:MAG TPA: zinc ribbon domain-containing protein [Thermoguttaceae bacterium]|nr:zinc ribbon domain-containing protein [Thermoguttaceae bacterium]